ncbi:FAD-dependent monooxygenase [Paraburkholderia bannensis]|uniref:FAD-dependent monooxygenase n=1 Tax=Paraburkholderia bannensis TaxID=765414 RepID=UPI0004809836|nr:FAD-dependent monooxygenase [Paraburkholderia bannensis]
MRVIIAGGGIVGLTAGIAFKAIGWDVLVCEQASEIRAAGAAIGLWRNALDVFGAVGVGDAIASIGTTVETWFYDASGQPFRAPGFDPVDHTFLLVPRPELNRRLAAAVGVDNIHVDTRVVAFNEHADHVSVTFDDGSVERADLLLGADGAYSAVRAQLIPGYPAQAHAGHHVWRGMLAAGDEPAAGSVLTVGHQRARGGFTRTYGNQVVWMVNQFDSAAPAGTKKAEALQRAALLNDAGWNDALLALIERTPEAQILHNPIMFVPPLPCWTSSRVALIGDAAHALSPHISAGGTLGVEDIQVLTDALQRHDDLATALQAYERNRLPHYARVRELAYSVEIAPDAAGYALEYARFSHWMLNDGYRASRQ